MRRARLLLLLCAALAPSLAHAESIAVLGLEAIETSEADAARLTDAMRQRLAGTGTYRVVQGKDLVEMKLVFGCMDETGTACIAQAGKSLGADKLIYGSVKWVGKKGGKLSISLRLLDVKTGNEDRYIPTEQVEPSELKEGAVNGVATRLLGALLGLAANATLTVTSDPSGADVTVDDKARGHTPITISDLAPGSHVVVIAKDGFQTRTETSRFRAGDAAKLDVGLEPAAGVVDVTPRPRKVAVEEEHPGRTLRILGIVGLIAAAALEGVAIYTFTQYRSLQDEAHNALGNVQSNFPAYAADQPATFNSPNCKLPPSMKPGVSSPTADTSKDAKTYLGDCDSGGGLAGATTGLVIGGMVLGAAGIAALVIGIRQMMGEGEKRPVSSSPSAWFAPRLRLLSPTAGPTGGGLTATFEF